MVQNYFRTKLYLNIKNRKIISNSVISNFVPHYKSVVQFKFRFSIRFASVTLGFPIKHSQLPLSLSQSVFYTLTRAVMVHQNSLFGPKSLFCWPNAIYKWPAAPFCSPKRKKSDISMNLQFDHNLPTFKIANLRVWRPGFSSRNLIGIVSCWETL